MQRGSDRLSVHRDDEMKHELKGLLQSGHPTRVEEWNDPEPAADDDPDVLPPGARAPEAGERLRLELARHLARTAFPGKRSDMLRVLRERHAPDPLVELVERAPEDRTYGTVRELVDALGEQRG
ncbi:DUF2795 domain-containing protein [Streptomyces sp. NPDC059506]|uniref:DUF2795 domain-containing protein n=1 Tax=Streptomyces TaxID=1883 RepID=UPI003679B595